MESLKAGRVYLCGSVTSVQLGVEVESDLIVCMQKDTGRLGGAEWYREGGREGLNIPLE